MYDFFAEYSVHATVRKMNVWVKEGDLSYYVENVIENDGRMNFLVTHSGL